MLTALSIRDVVLIERLDLAFGPGLTVLTGETGAGKSILLDSLGLALGARADAGLVRAGATQASVTAAFSVAADHPAQVILEEQGIEAADDLLLRRVVGRDGKSRAFVNDGPVSAGTLRRVGAALVEVLGQDDRAGLADAGTHLGFLDGYGVPGALRDAVRAAYRARAAAVAALDAAEAAQARAAEDEAYLRHTLTELGTLAPRPDEEAALVAQRQALQAQERHAEAIALALKEFSPGSGGGFKRGAANAGPAAALRGAARALSRLARDGEENPAADVLAALDRAEAAVAEAEEALSRLARDADADPRGLEQAEARLFALRAAARKYGVTVDGLAAFLDETASRLAALDAGSGALAGLRAARAAADAAYREAAGALSGARRAAAGGLEAAVTAELAPLRLGRARFVVDVAARAEDDWSANGADAVTFLMAANPGTAPGPLGRVASGGELARVMLALKVVLASAGSVGTMVFDEVDSGVGGATAAAVGERLARVAVGVQVMVVTHSPQVAARGAAHLVVAKETVGEVSRTGVRVLDPAARREEIARMLAGERVTDAARAAAEVLLGAAA